MPEYDLKPIAPASVVIGDVIKYQLTQWGAVTGIGYIPPEEDPEPGVTTPGLWVFQYETLEPGWSLFGGNAVVPDDVDMVGIKLEVRTDVPAINQAFTRPVDGSQWVYTARGYLCTVPGVYPFGSLYPLKDIAPLVAS